MEYERFYNFGFDPMAAKWYLLTGSAMTPQRYLCRTDYAVKKNFPNFGSYAIFSKHDNKELLYSYVILNIFDIPFAELQNFFLLSCDQSIDLKRQEATEFDMSFKKVFTSGRERTLPNIDVRTNTTELSSNYLSGIENIAPILDWQLHMNVLSCDQTQQQENDTSVDIEMLPTQTQSPLKRRTEEQNGARSGKKIQIKENILLNPPDNSLFCNTEQTRQTPVSVQRSIESDLIDLPSSSSLPFPSAEIIEEQESIIYQSPTPVTMINPLDINLQLNKPVLSELGQRISASTEKMWFLSDLMYRIQVDFNTNKLNFIQLGTENKIAESLDLNSYGIDVLSKYYSRLIYPSFLNEREARTMYVESFCKDPKYQLFLDYVKMEGDKIIEIVESPDIETFKQNVEKHNNIWFYTLYGLCVYLKQRKPTWTLQMEIEATCMTKNQNLFVVSSFLVRAYFRAKNEQLRFTENSVCMWHLLDYNVNDISFNGTKAIMEDVDAQQDLQMALPYLTTVTFNIDENGVIPENSYYALNTFTIDHYGQYVYTPRGHYFANEHIRHGVLRVSEKLMLGLNKIPNLFSNSSYLGPCYFVKTTVP